MASFPTVRVAAVQATPVILDVDATIDRAVHWMGQAAAAGVDLVVLPECFVSVYPSGAWAAAAATWSDGCDELWERMWASSVDVDGPHVARLVQACARPRCPPRHRRERAGGRASGLALQLAAGPRPARAWSSATASSMPTMHERVFHGIGAGDDLRVVDLPGVGRVGGLICWENRMPLARWALYEGGPADLAGAHGGRQRRLAGVDAAHRHRVRGLRRQRPAVHPP